MLISKMLIQEGATKVRFHFRESALNTHRPFQDEQGGEKNEIRWKILAPTFGEHKNLNIEVAQNLDKLRWNPTFLA